jgi:DNA-binding transcriptional LysR family regulator
VLSLQRLAAFDCYHWLGSEHKAAAQLHVNQSTVSRHVKHVQAFFHLDRPSRSLGVSQASEQSARISPNLELLNLQRSVHQLARLRGYMPLRIEATYWAGPAFLRPIPEGWITSEFKLLGMELPLRLLRDRVIDAWLASYQPDLPTDDPHLCVIDLLSMPVRLLVDLRHPLMGVRHLTPGDLSRFPSLALPEGWFPQTEQILKRQGLWNDPVQISRYDPGCWEGRCADQVSMSYGQTLSQRLAPELVPLDWDLQLFSGEALVVRRDIAEAGPVQQLLATLQQRARALVLMSDDLQLA